MTLLPKLLGNEQVCGVPGRNIFWNLSAVRNTVEYYQTHSQEQAALLSLDFDKAFDRVNHSFLFSVLEKLNFPQFLISILQRLYNASRSKVQLNGYFTKTFPVKRGVRQGCPLSMILFAFSLEPFIRNLHNRLLEYKSHRINFTLRAYADDVTVLLQYPHDEHLVMEAAHNYNLASGAKLNNKKSTLMPLAAWPSTAIQSHFTLRDEIRILGINFKPTLEETLENNWKKKLIMYKI